MQLFFPQTAAGSLTLLYKDSLEELRKAAEINRKLVRHSLIFMMSGYFTSKIARATRGPGLMWQPGPRASEDSSGERSFLLSLLRTLLARYPVFQKSLGEGIFQIYPCLQRGYLPINDCKKIEPDPLARGSTSQYFPQRNCSINRFTTQIIASVKGKA